MITQERLRELLDYEPDTGVFTWRRRPGSDRYTNAWNAKNAGKTAGRISANGYRDISIDGRQRRAHRLAWMHVYGAFPSDYIDHINGNPDDNRLANLREATKIQNGHNSKRRRDNISGFKGVSWSKRAGKWYAQIKAGGRRIYLGYYECPVAAHCAYAAAADKYHGAFANVGEGSPT